jgi:hypothetical protein
MMKDEGQKKEIIRAWLKLFCFMTSSARGCVKEPTIYGPFRLVDSIEKIITILDKQGMADDFFRKEKKKIEERKLVLVEDEEAFVNLLDELVMDFAKELKNY